MNKTDYMNTLRQELEGLPAETVEDTMWAYEGRFVDGMAAGRDEQDIANSLPVPHLVAAQKRATLRFEELKKNTNPTHVASLLLALLGVLAVNLLMVIPAIAYSALLFASYFASLAMYVVGIVMTAIVLSGTPQINVDVPSHHRVHVGGVLSENFSENLSENISRSHENVRVDITPTGITVDQGENGQAGSVAASMAASSASSTAASGSEKSSDKVNVDDAAIHVSIGNHLTSIHLFHGLAFLLGGIALLMFSLFMTKYTFIGCKNYLRWNLSLLRPAASA